MTAGHSRFLAPLLDSPATPYLHDRSIVSRFRPVVLRAFCSQALTAPFANPDWNYERLENLGDALLKYTVSVHLFLKYPRLHEGQLSTLRMQMVSNAWLHKRAVWRRNH